MAVLSIEKLMETPDIDELKMGNREPSYNVDFIKEYTNNGYIKALLAYIDNATGEEKVLLEDFLAEVSQDKTAVKLGCSQKTVSNRRVKLFEKIKKVLLNQK